MDDICEGFDDILDADADAVPDGCDQCGGDDATCHTDTYDTADDLHQVDRGGAPSVNNKN